MGELRISTSTDQDGDTTFDIVISQGTVQTHVCFWGETSLFQQFGQELTAFPKSISDGVEIEIGQIGLGSYQNYLLLRAYCYDANGHSALKIVTHNNEAEPQTQRIEFSIPAEAAALNRLGNQLKSWEPAVTPELAWKAQTS